MSEVHHSATGGANISIQYQYDQFDRLVNKKLVKGSFIEEDSNFSYENQMDAELLKTANNRVVNLGFTKQAVPPFASMGYSVSSAQSGNPLGLIEDSFTITRDVTGNIASISGANLGQIYAKAYDAAGRLTAVDAGALKTAIAYDTFGRKSKIAYSDGTSGEIAYDSLNRITGMVWKERYKDSVQQFLKYDAAGNIVNMAREHSKYALGYDSTDQLIQSKFVGMNGVPAYNKGFAYDFAGNRQDGEVIGNFLLNNSASKFLADQSGFGELEKEITGDQVKIYTYRADGKVASLQSGNLSVNYLYDGLDRLVAKQVNNGTAFTQSYVNLGAENRVLLAKSGDNTVTTYIDGKGISEHLGEVKAGVGKGYITDQLGSVVNAAPAGEHKSYGLFGEPALKPAISPSSPAKEYAYAGYGYRREDGNYETDNRVYNPVTGRWLSQDPIGYDSGDTNNYRYVGNNPILYIDPTGNACLTNGALVGGTLIVGGIAVIAKVPGLPGLCVGGAAVVVGAGIVAYDANTHATGCVDESVKKKLEETRKKIDDELKKYKGPDPESVF